jgi:Asp-tRNA(Asn)/Glu-tRNA(Gln) amidotransferase A subunit family amidase
LAGTASDTALAYAVMAGPDLRDPNSLHQPLPTLENWDQLNLRGLKLGVYKQWFQHADPEVVAACETMLKRFAEMGAEIREIVIPDLELNRTAQTVTIVSEMVQAMSYTYAKHHREHGLDVRLNLALGRAFNAQDYLLAQRARTRIIRNFENALKEVDMILTPTTAIAAPPIPKDALPDGNSDLSTTIEIMRFVTAGNMTGLPAISFPVGYTTKGMPVGMQAIGRAWQESLLLRLALNAEQALERKEPQVHFRVL